MATPVTALPTPLSATSGVHLTEEPSPPTPDLDQVAATVALDCINKRRNQHSPTIVALAHSLTATSPERRTMLLLFADAIREIEDRLPAEVQAALNAVVKEEEYEYLLK